MAHLEYVNIHGGERSVFLRNRELNIGRDPTCDICFPDKSMSRIHARVQKKGPHCYVVDNGSTNGTRVNDEKVDTAILSDGDTISLGAFSLRFFDESSLPGRVVSLDDLLKKMTTPLVPGSTIDMAAAWTWMGNLSQCTSGTTLLNDFVKMVRDVLNSRIVSVVVEGRHAASTAPGADDAQCLQIIDKYMTESRRNGVARYLSATDIGNRGTDDDRVAVCLPLLTAHGNPCGALYADIQKGEATGYEESMLVQMARLGRVVASIHKLVVGMAVATARTRLVSGESGQYGTLVGESSHATRMRIIVHQKVGPQDTPVLITGEEGVGKNHLARALHLASDRTTGPFVPVSCNYWGIATLEQILFGEGPDSTAAGAIAAARGGTLFLDGVEHVPFSVQGQVLLLIQEHVYRRPGGSQAVSTNVRILAAAEDDLARRVDDGRFRSDLYQRLKIVQLALLPLCRRREDILPLAGHFLRRFSLKMGKRGVSLGGDALAALECYRWPGNIRELSNVMERAVTFASDYTLISKSMLPRELHDDAMADRLEGEVTRRPTIKMNETALLLAALEQSGGDRGEAARILDWPRSLVDKRLDEQNRTEP